MDDRTKGVGDERTSGFGDDETIGRADDPTARRRSATVTPVDRTRGWNDDRTRASAGIAERDETAEVRTQQIRAEIEQTRDDMSETIDAIQDRLSPRTIAANAAASVRDTASAAVENVREAASETFEDFSDSRMVQEVRSNPIPAAMVGLGIIGAAWLAFGGRDTRSAGRRRGRTEMYDHGGTVGYYEPREDYYRGSRGRRAASGWSTASGPDYTTAEEPGSTTADIASRTSDYAREASWKARQTARRAQNQLQRAITENPLAVGAAALTVGAMIGMALPETERENELLGETRDSVVEGAQEMARNAATRVQEAASDAAKRVQDAATDAVGLLENKNPK